MTYDEAEQSVFAGNPVELYVFQCGSDVWRLTSADTPIDADEQEYTPIAIRRGSAGQNSELSGGTIKVLLPAAHEIAQKFIPFSPFSPVSLTISRKHVGIDERVVIWAGRAVSASFGDECELTCEPESAQLKKRIPPQRFQRQCNRILYDTGCGIDPNDFKISATITAISATQLETIGGSVVITAAEFADRPDQWLAGGYVEIGSQRQMILWHVGENCVVLAPFVGVTAPVAAEAFAGCDRTFADCVNKFDNGKRFLGFEWAPAVNPFKSGLQ